MPPFQYKTFIDPYVGSIAQLMGQQGQRQADAAERIAAIRAQEALQRGEIWGGAIQGIGNLAADTMTEWNSPEARRQRELDKARKINVDRSGEMQQHIGTRRVLGHAVPEIVPPEQTDPVAGMYGNALLGGDARVGTSPVDKYGNALLGGDALVGTSPDTSPLSRRLEGAFGTVREGRTPDDLQPYLRDSVSRYTTKDGLYDIKLAYSDLLEKGISPEVANMIAKQGLEANTIFSAADDIAEKFRESQVEVRGTIAHMAISLHEASPGMSWDEALDNTIGPGMTRENPDELKAFQKMFVRESPEGKENILRGFVDEWERQSDKTVVPAGAQQVSDVTGKVISSTPFRPPATTSASLSQQGYNDYLKVESNKGTPIEKILSYQAWMNREQAIGTELGTSNKLFGAPYGRINNDTGEPELVQRMTDGTEQVVGTPLLTAAGSSAPRLVYDRAGDAYTFYGNAPEGKKLIPLTFEDGTPFRKALPSSLVSMSIGAETIGHHIQPLVDMAIELDRRKLFGPIQGRLRAIYERFGTANFLNENDDSLTGRMRTQAELETLGSDIEQDLLENFASTNTDPIVAMEEDRLIGQFATSLALMASGAGRVHGGARGGGSISMIRYMKGLVSGIGTVGMFTGRMDSLADWMSGYAEMMSVEEGLLPSPQNGDDGTGSVTF
jgi:hypothetical protein